MGGAGCDNPGDSPVGIRAIPNPAARGHLVLPLLQGPAGYLATAQSVFGWVGYRAKIVAQGTGELLDQLRIGMDGGSGLPLSHRLGQRCPLPHLRRSLKARTKSVTN